MTLANTHTHSLTQVHTHAHIHIHIHSHALTHSGKHTHVVPSPLLPQIWLQQECANDPIRLPSRNQRWVHCNSQPVQPALEVVERRTRSQRYGPVCLVHARRACHGRLRNATSTLTAVRRAFRHACHVYEHWFSYDVVCTLLSEIMRDESCTHVLCYRFEYTLALQSSMQVFNSLPCSGILG